jgi:single-strand DNA-binding protein
MNSITVVGNLTRDPELRFLQSGRPVCNMGLASSRRYQVNGEWQEQTTLFNLTLWGEAGENAASTFTKGMRVIASGRMESREYEHEGQKRTAFDFIVDEMGPSIRWARAQVEKITREGGPAASAPAASSGGSGTHDPIYSDEPPF